MWKGQFNAILGLILVGSGIYGAAADSPSALGNGFAIVVVLWILAVLANLVSKALFGFPLLYSKKHVTKRTEDGAITRES